MVSQWMNFSLVVVPSALVYSTSLSASEILLSEICSLAGIGASKDDESRWYERCKSA
jgi:hypothetical protein